MNIQQMVHQAMIHGIRLAVDLEPPPYQPSKKKKAKRKGKR